jgi:hypothetical protein
LIQLERPTRVQTPTTTRATVLRIESAAAILR